MNLKKAKDSLKKAASESFSYTNPVPGLKSPIGGKLLAWWRFIFRITSLLQFIKFCCRIPLYYFRNKTDPIPPIIQELYVFLSILVGFSICQFVYFWEDSSFYMETIKGFAIWKVYETVNASLFYSLLRPVFETDSPISIPRRLLLTMADCIVVILFVGIGRSLINGLDIPPDTDRIAFVINHAFSSSSKTNIDMLLLLGIWIQLSLSFASALTSYQSRVQGFGKEKR